MDKKIRAEIFSRRFSRMQVIILGRIDEELDDDVFVKVMTANFLTVTSVSEERVFPQIAQSHGADVLHL